MCVRACVCVCVCACVCFAGNMQVPAELSAGVFAVKERYKSTLQSRSRWMRAHQYDSQDLGLGFVQKLAGLLRSVR